MPAYRSNLSGVCEKAGAARVLVSLLSLTLSLIGGCAGGAAVVAPGSPISEKELAMRHLQKPLDQTLCKAAVYPNAGADWRLQRVQAFVGRGQSFETALEALCREVEGRKLPAVVDIYFARVPSGWSPNFEVRGTAVRFDDGYTPPEPPARGSIRPPEMPTNLDVEPPPAGEKKTSMRHRKRAGLSDQAAAATLRHSG